MQAGSSVANHCDRNSAQLAQLSCGPAVLNATRVRPGYGCDLGNDLGTGCNNFIAHLQMAKTFLREVFGIVFLLSLIVMFLSLHSSWTLGSFKKKYRRELSSFGSTGNISENLKGDHELSSMSRSNSSHLTSHSTDVLPSSLTSKPKYGAGHPVQVLSQSLVGPETNLFADLRHNEISGKPASPRQETDLYRASIDLVPREVYCLNVFVLRNDTELIGGDIGSVPAAAAAASAAIRIPFRLAEVPDE